MNKKRKEIILGIVFVGSLAFFGLDSCLYSLRIDVTENKMFSIHPVSRNLFKDITDQVHITYYLTDKLKGTSAVFGQIEDILREYAADSNGKITLDVFDPVRDNKVTEVQEYQIREFSSGVQQAEDETSVFIAYSGLVIQYLDRTRVVPVIQTVDTLEYDLSSNIRGLVSNRIKKIGYLLDKDDLNMNDFPMEVANLQRNFEVQEIQRDMDIPATLDAVFIIGGASLSEFDLYPIDQYIMRGGRVLFASEAVKLNMQYGVAVPAGQAPLFAMLKSYGATVLPGLVMEHSKLSLPTAQGMYNYFLSTYQEFAAKDNPITAHFAPVYFFWASPLEINPTGAVKIETLISSSPYSVVAKEDFRLSPREAAMMYEVYASDKKGSVPLAAALSGNFTSYFKDKPIPHEKNVKKDWAKPEPSSPPTRLIVAGDSDFISPDYLTNNNYSFFINSLNWLTNDDDLLAIRTRVQRDTSMGKIQDQTLRNTAVTLILLINLVGVPLLVIGFGLLNFLLRRKKRKA